MDDKDASILGANWLVQGGATWEQGDFNEDGNVNDTDAAILAAHWGETMNETNVPEPCSITLLVWGAIAGLMRWKHQR